jgi:hypothetical protein
MSEENQYQLAYSLEILVPNDSVGFRLPFKRKYRWMQLRHHCIRCFTWRWHSNNSGGLREQIWSTAKRQTDFKFALCIEEFWAVCSLHSLRRVFWKPKPVKRTPNKPLLWHLNGEVEFKLSQAYKVSSITASHSVTKGLGNQYLRKQSDPLRRHRSKGARQNHDIVCGVVRLPLHVRSLSTELVAIICTPTIQSAQL